MSNRSALLELIGYQIRIVVGRWISDLGRWISDLGRWGWLDIRFWWLRVVVVVGGGGGGGVGVVAGYRPTRS